jgi:hypothetical protein
MIKKPFLIYSFPALIILIMCGCHPLVQSQANSTATLIFGQGGGITGKYTEYSLVVDRNIYSNDLSTGKKTWLKKINKKDCRDLFIEAESLRLMKMDFNHPYNINYYIIYRKGTAEKKVNWGDARTPPPAGVKEFWDKLWALTK